jgi:hypothetical protein
MLVDALQPIVESSLKPLSQVLLMEHVATEKVGLLLVCRSRDGGMKIGHYPLPLDDGLSDSSGAGVDGRGKHAVNLLALLGDHGAPVIVADDLPVTQ